MKNRQHIIEQFSQFISALPEPNAQASLDLGDLGIEPSNNQQKNETIDLMSLFQVLYVLKNEVKTESRQVKTALDEFKAVFSSLNSNQGYLQKSIDNQQHTIKTQQQQLRQQNNQLLKPLLLSLLELCDSLNNGLNAFDQPKPTGWLARFKLPLWQKLQTIKYGQQITLRQLQQVLEQYQVQAIHSVGQTYDPMLMKAVATESNPEKSNNQVITEQLKGYLWQDKLLRLAQVTVNNTTNTTNTSNTNKQKGNTQDE
ncbi:MAG: molecular chaperone GrpE [Phenylobacterium sp.]|jgi:molecular chaperone GrpE